MYHIYANLSTSRHDWKSAYEVQAAASAHEKRQYQRSDLIPLAKAQNTAQKKHLGWAARLVGAR